MSDTKVSQEKLAETISGLFPGQVTTVVHTKQPHGQSKSTNNPYYKEKFALQLKAEIEKMDATKKDITFLYKNSPELSKHSLYLKLNQSFRYLEDNLDFNPPNRFRDLRARIKITREKDGVRFSFVRKDLASGLIATMVVHKDDNINWKDRMELFFQNSKPKDVFEQQDLLLTKEEMESIVESVSGLQNFLLDISTSHIKILHLTDEV